MFGIVIDSESEQRELDDRYPDHHRKGQTIPSHLQQFLGDDAPETLQRSGYVTHSEGLMAASSRPGDPGVPSGDEQVFKARLDGVLSPGYRTTGRGFKPRGVGRRQGA